MPAIPEQSKYDTSSLDKFVDSYRTLENLTDKQAETVKNYLEKLEKAGKLFADQVGDWERFYTNVTAVVDALDTVPVSLQEIRDIFASIGKGLSSDRERFRQNQSLIRSISRESERQLEILYETDQFTKGNIDRSIRGSLRIKNEFLQRQKLALEELGISQDWGESEQLRSKKLEEASGKAFSKMKEYEREQLALQVELRNHQDVWGAAEKKAQQERIRHLGEAVKYWGSVSEIVDYTNTKRVEGIAEAARKTKEFRQEELQKDQTGSWTINIVTKFAKKVGLETVADSVKEDYASLIQNRVRNRQERQEIQTFKKAQISDFANVDTKKTSDDVYSLSGQLVGMISEGKKLSEIFGNLRFGEGEEIQLISNLQSLKDIQKELADNPVKTSVEKEDLKALTSIINLLGEREELEAREKGLVSEYERLQGGVGEILKKNLESVKSIAAGMKSWLTWGGLAVGALQAAFLIARAAWKGFTAINESAVELKRQTGLWYQNLAGVNDKFATSVDWLNTATDLSKEYGMNMAAALGKNEIADLAEMKNLLGISSKEAGNLAVLSKINNRTTESTLGFLEDTVNTSNIQNKSYVNLRAVMNDVLNVSQDIQAKTGNNVENLIKAATAARRLGSDLEGVNRIADSLLDFESSISKQMEAQLMTGRAFNLNQARAAALSGDLEKVAEEIANQGITLDYYSGLNVYAQKSLAEMLGLSVGEMNQMLQKQQMQENIARNLVGDQEKQYIASLKAASVAEEWNKSIQKLQQAFGPILNVVILIADAISGIITTVSSVIGGIASVFGLAGKGQPGLGLGSIAEEVGPATAEYRKVMNSMKGVAETSNEAGGAVKDMSGEINQGATEASSTLAGILTLLVGIGAWHGKGTVLNAVKNIVFSVKEWAKNLGAVKAVQETLGTIKTKLTPKWYSNAAAARQKSLAEKAGEAVSSKGTENINSTTQAASRTGARATNMLKGAAAIALFAGAMFLFAKAIQEFQKIDTEDWLLGLAKMSGTILGLSATLAIAKAIGPALQSTLSSIAEAVVSFGTVLMSGNVATLAGLAGLAAIAGILWVISPTIEAAGNALKSVLEGISSVVEKAAIGVGEGVSKVVDAWYSGKTALTTVKAEFVKVQGEVTERVLAAQSTTVERLNRSRGELVEKIGGTINSVLGSVASVTEKIGNTITSVIKQVGDTLVVVGSIDGSNLLQIGAGLGAIALGLTALAGVSIGSSIAEFFGAGPAAELERLVTAGEGMTVLATALTAVASSLAALNVVLENLDADKISAVRSLGERSLGARIDSFIDSVKNVATRIITPPELREEKQIQPVAEQAYQITKAVTVQETVTSQEKTKESNGNSREIKELKDSLKTINQKFDTVISLVRAGKNTTMNVTLDQRVFDHQVIRGSSL